MQRTKYVVDVRFKIIVLKLKCTGIIKIGRDS